MGLNAAHEQTRILVQAAAAVCEDKKGLDTRILELDPVDSGLADFFLITSALNNRQSVAIADEIEYRLKHDLGQMVHSVEGRKLGDWILLDYVDFVVHVFLAERRAFYDIERLRKSARPLTPAEFDAELTSDLAKKTKAVRKKTGAKKKAAVKKPLSARKATTTVEKKRENKMVKKAAKKAVKKAAPIKKAVAKKVAPAKKAPLAKKAVPAKKAVTKVAAKPAKKAVKKVAKKSAK